MDAEPFMEWVKGRDGKEGVGIISQLGMQNQDFVYDAATFAVHEATEKLMINRFGELVSEVILAMPYLVEAMVRGFAKTKGLTLSVERNEREDIVLAHEPLMIQIFPRCPAWFYVRAGSFTRRVEYRHPPGRSPECGWKPNSGEMVMTDGQKS